MRAQHGRDPAREVAAHRDLLARRLGVEVDEHHGRLLAWPRRRAAAAISNGLQAGSGWTNSRPIRLTTATRVPSRASTTVEPRPGLRGEVVGRPHDARLAIEIGAESPLVPGVVAERDAVDAAREDAIGEPVGDAGAVGGVLAVGDHEVELELLAQARHERLDRFASGPAEDVRDEQQPHRGRSYGIAGAVAGSTRMLAPLPASET